MCWGEECEPTTLHLLASTRCSGLLQQEWQLSDPQGDSEEVGHVREAAMLGLHPRQRRSHVLLTLLRVGRGGGGFNRTFQLYGTGNFVNLSTNKFNSIVIDSHSHFQFMFVSVYDLNKY